jgi:hypothetical protein
LIDTTEEESKQGSISSLWRREKKEYSSCYLFQIDQNTLLKMDKNLFLGEEIREVYKEIMQTVPTDHLELENVSSRPLPSIITWIEKKPIRTTKMGEFMIPNLHVMIPSTYMYMHVH